MYTYGKKFRTHNAVLVLIKRTLTLWELSDSRLAPEQILFLLQEDEQLHPSLRTAIKEAVNQKEKSVWITFWNNEQVITPILRNIINLGYQQSQSVSQTLRAALSLAAFEEERLRNSLTQEEKYADEYAESWSI